MCLIHTVWDKKPDPWQSCKFVADAATRLMFYHHPGLQAVTHVRVSTRSTEAR